MYLFYRINQGIISGLDWIFPPVCGGCDRPGSTWCTICQQQVRTMPEPVCEQCGLPMLHQGLCMTCLEENPSFERLRSWLIFEGPIRQALHKIKYRRNFSLGEALARQFSRFVDGLAWPVDLVIPVPLGKQRMRERGYNQVGLVAMPLAAKLNLQYAPRAVVRSRETKSQVGLSIKDRKENVAGAFLANRKIVSGKKILLLDDVATTGSTISACASSLLKAGARSVYALTLARALPHHDLKMV